MLKQKKKYKKGLSIYACVISDKWGRRAKQQNANAAALNRK